MMRPRCQGRSARAVLTASTTLVARLRGVGRCGLHFVGASRRPTPGDEQARCAAGCRDDAGVISGEATVVRCAKRGGHVRLRIGYDDEHGSSSDLPLAMKGKGRARPMNALGTWVG